MIKILIYGLLVVFVLVIVLALALWVGSAMSMDRDFTYSAKVAELPEFSPRTEHEVVTIAAGSYRYRARVAGFADGEDKPFVILLHGFPVTSAMWNELMDPIAQAGFRVVAFDQRGYSPGARPENVDEYVTSKLIADVLAVADAVGAEQFHLIGHDWGAAVGWGVVLGHPDRVQSWSGLSIAHPQAFQEALLNDPDQQARSRYFMFFRTPWLAESVFTFNNLSLLRGLFGVMPKEEADEYIALFSEPGGLTAGLNWYRAMGSEIVDTDGGSPDVAIPTLFVWGNKDGAVGRAAIDAMARYMKGPYRNVELDAGHWLLADEPDRVIDEVVGHLLEYRERPAVP